MKRLVFYMLRNPDVMQKCQKEIDGVTGRERMSSMKDKASMPYVGGNNTGSTKNV